MTEKQIWDNPKTLEILEEKRDKHRQDIKILTFDCFNAIVPADRIDRVICKKEHQFATPGYKSGDGSLSLLSVLKGTTSSQCKMCLDFDG